MFGKGSWYHYVQIGARLHPLETLLVYLLPIATFASPSLSPLFWRNAITQLAIFIPVVQIPALVTGHMSYVDLGWPFGLVALALTTMIYGEGYSTRRYVVCGCMLLHGLRMALGALKLFYPYVWKQDLPRYRYARVRFEGKDGMPSGGWWLKMQHDTLQQAYANSVILAVPVVLCAMDTAETISPVEILGWATWLLSWVWENKADIQKKKFLKKCVKIGKESPEKKDEVKLSVLGYAPFDGPEFSCWTRCRHPNYFGEWMCWNAFVLTALPSLVRLSESGLESGLTVAALAVSLFYCTRIFFDCLAFWTGAEPAEHFSVQKRPLYKEYQEKVRMFFPFELPCVDHCRVAGWPESEDRKSV